MIHHHHGFCRLSASPINDQVKAVRQKLSTKSALARGLRRRSARVAGTLYLPELSRQP